MMIAVLLSGVLTGQMMRALPTAQPVPLRPLTFTLAAAPRALSGHQAEREIVCGMVVVKQSPDADAKILLPRRETGAAVRRIEPGTCGVRSVVPAK
jgi:hypothetical protein